MKALIITGLLLTFGFISIAQSQNAPVKKETEKKEQQKPEAKKSDKKDTKKDKDKPKQGKKIAIDQEGVSEDHLKKKKAPTKK